MPRARPRTETAARLVPSRPTLRRLRVAAAGCTACPLWERATQTVFGAGPERAPIMLVGEQPGNDEDRTGAPFVGPAGKLLDAALVDAGVDRRRVYVTNVVKHFKWQPRGKRRIHEKPRADEIAACFPWLEAEIDVIRPHVVVALGATAARTLLGAAFRLTREHGKLVRTDDGPARMATLHPSAVLRAPDRAARAQARRQLVGDLRKLRRFLAPAS